MSEEHKAKLKAGREAKKAVKDGVSTTTTAPVSDFKDTVGAVGNDTPPATGTTVPPKEDVVTMSRADFDSMMSKFDKMASDVNLLYRASDKNRLAKELNKEGQDLIHQTNVRTWGNTGRLIVRWDDLVTNRSEIIQGKWYEEQSTTFYFEDGEAKTVPYLEFVRQTLTKIPADIVGRTTDMDTGNLIFKLKFENGKILLIDSRFVN